MKSREQGLIRHNVNSRMFYYKHKSLGLCVECSRPLQTKTRCEIHAREMRETYHRNMEKIRAMRGGEQMKKGTRFKVMNEDSFTIIKTLQKAGMSGVKIQQVTGRSSGTQNYVKQAKDFSDYKEIVRQAIKRGLEKKAVKTNGVLVTETAQEKEAEVKAEHTSEPTEFVSNWETLQVLKDIRKELGRLADAWETPSQKKGFFERLAS